VEGWDIAWLKMWVSISGCFISKVHSKECLFIFLDIDIIHIKRLRYHSKFYCALGKI